MSAFADAIPRRAAMAKVYPSAEAALRGVVANDQTLAVGGFGLCGISEALILALRGSGVTGSPRFLTALPRVVHVAVAESYFDPLSRGSGAAIQIHHRNPTITAEVVSCPASRLRTAAHPACFAFARRRATCVSRADA